MTLCSASTATDQLRTGSVLRSSTDGLSDVVTACCSSYLLPIEVNKGHSMLDLLLTRIQCWAIYIAYGDLFP